MKVNTVSIPCLLILIIWISIPCLAQPGDPHGGDPDLAPITGTEILLAIGGLLGATKLLISRPGLHRSLSGVLRKRITRLQLQKTPHLLFFLFPLFAVGQSSGDFRSHQSGSWNAQNTWEKWDGLSWITPAPDTPGINSGEVRLRAMHVIDMNTSVTVRQVSIDSTASLNIASGKTMRLTGDLLNGGEIRSSGGMVEFSGSDTKIAGTGATYFFDLKIDSGANVTALSPISVIDNMRIDGVLISHDLIFAASATVSANGNLDLNRATQVAGTLTVSEGGTLTAERTSDLTLSGNLSVNGTMVSMASVEFQGTTTITGTGSRTFNDVVVMGSVTPNGACTITGNLTVRGNGTLKPGNNTTTFNGPASEMVNVGTGTVAFNRLMVTAGSQLSSFSYFTCKSTLTSRGTLVSNGGFSAAGSVRVSPTTGYLSIRVVPAVISGNLTVSSNAMLSSDVDITLSGNLSVTGSLISMGRTTFAGNTTITGSGIKTFNEVLITGTVVANSGWQLSGNLEVPGGLESGNNTTFFDGNTIISGAGGILFNHIQINLLKSVTISVKNVSIAGNIINNGQFDPSSTTVSFTGNFSKSIIQTDTMSAIEFNNIIIEGGTSDPDLTFETDIRLQGALTLGSGATLDADGTLNNRIFVLESINDNPASDASIAAVPEGSGIVGKITVQRFMSGEGRIYRYLSSPVYGATIATWQKSFPVTGTFQDPSNPGVICGKSVKSRSPSLFYYDESSSDYIQYPSSGWANESLLEVGRGYAVFIRNCSVPTVVSSEGTLVEGVNMGQINLPVTHSADVFTFNNLVGNPYPSAIDWDSVSLKNISPTIAVRDNGSGVFRYYTQGGLGASDIPDGIIAQGQAFWVRTTHSNPSLAISENAKVPSSNLSGAEFYRTREPDILEITLTGSTQIQSDNAYVLQASGSTGTPTLDNLDAPKMNNQQDDPYVELFDVYTSVVAGSTPLAVNALPKIDCNTEIPLIVRDGRPGHYDLRIRRKGLLSKLKLYLRDKYLSTTIQITEQDAYSFTIETDTASASLNRFTLVFKDHALDSNVRIETMGLLCDGDTAKVSLTNTNSNVRYFLRSLDNVVSDTLNGDVMVQFRIGSGMLLPGPNMIFVEVIDQCQTYTLNQSAIIQMIRLDMPFVNAKPHCLKGAVTMTVLNTPPGGTFYWYQTPDDMTPVFVGPEFRTPVLEKSRTYFVASADSSNRCQSHRTRVTAIVVQYDSAVITQIGSEKLESNFNSGNHWYLNGQQLADSSYAIDIASSGLYKLEVIVGECLNKTEKEIIVDAVVDSLDSIHVYPNPVSGAINIEISELQWTPDKISVYSPLWVKLGEVALSRQPKIAAGTFDFGPFPAGIYFLEIEFSDRKYSLKVIKQ